VADPFRIEELQRKVQQDPQSIAFAQLAEALRRAGRPQEAVDTCRAGLSNHPDYLSAHVTLGRSLVDTGDLDAAQDELTRVLNAAPENLAAVKGLADIHQRRGHVREALEQYRRALDLAPHDADLEHIISELATGLGPAAHPIGPGDNGSLGLVPAGPTAGGTTASAEQTGPSRDEVAASPATAGDRPEGGQPPAHLASLQVEALERWLEAILADRERQN
jgi:tetratricopeptide (TPR) repeat protein